MSITRGKERDTYREKNEEEERGRRFRRMVEGLKEC